MEPLLTPLLWSTSALLLCAAVAVLIWNARARASVGRAWFRERPRRLARVALLAVWITALAVTFLLRDKLPLAPSLAVLALSGLILLASPGFLDSVCGENGVQRGWHVRRYQELEEWRLMGDHLRWKLRGEWLASRLPADRHPALREKLTKLCPERESRFRA